MENSFAVGHPELVCERSGKNLPLTPEQIPYGSNKIYWWHGACGYEWTASRKKGTVMNGSFLNKTISQIFRNPEVEIFTILCYTVAVM